MSRIGKKPIGLPKGVQVSVSGRTVQVKGPKGTLSRDLHDAVNVQVDGSSIQVSAKEGVHDAKRFHGLTRSLLNNMIVGVSDGFAKRLKLVGVGYRAAMNGKSIALSLGYSHPVNFEPPSGIDIKVDGQTTVIVAGADKELVGQVSSTLRSFRPPEPYHGKGVRYEDEVIQTKVGKAAGKK